MRLIDELEAEHGLIDRVVGSFRTFVDARLTGAADPADGARFIRFFRRYAGDYHHAREEDTLFVALVEKVHLPQTGPISTLLDDHHRMASLLSDLEPLVGLTAFGPESASALARLATSYSAALWHHIDAENSVLLPEAAARLRKKGITELPSREMTANERAAKADGEALVRRYAPTEDHTIARGDGCVCCPALVDGCRGLESEWWNEWEWEEFHDHLAEG